MKLPKVLAVAVCLTLTVLAASAQRNISIGSPVTENFDILGTNSVNLSDDITIPGLYAVRMTGNASPNAMPVNNGGTNTGALYNIGSTGSSDRSAGTVSTNASGTNHLGMRIRNDGAFPIASLQVQYTGEQWRHGNGANETLTFEYQIGTTVTSLTAGTWTSVPALNFVSPTNPPGQGALDGNNAANRATLTSTILVNIPAGSEIMLRWTDIVDSAQPDAFGIDDLMVTPIGVSAGEVQISGRVTDAYGRSIRGAVISVQGSTGEPRRVVTNSFGYYSVPELDAGATYVVSISAIRYTFLNSPVIVDLSESLSGFDFVASR